MVKGLQAGSVTKVFIGIEALDPPWTLHRIFGCIDRQGFELDVEGHRWG